MSETLRSRNDALLIQREIDYAEKITEYIYNQYYKDNPKIEFYEGVISIDLAGIVYVSFFLTYDNGILEADIMLDYYRLYFNHNPNTISYIDLAHTTLLIAEGLTVFDKIVNILTNATVTLKGQVIYYED